MAEQNVDEHQEATIGGSTVANVLADLLELARNLGADKGHPAIRKAEAILETMPGESAS